MSAPQILDRPSRMNSKLIRELQPSQIPKIEMPACEVRPILKGQKAIVTGASSGIGRAIAVGLCAAGADVVINYIGDDGPARETVDLATHCGCTNRGQALIHRADVADEGQVTEMFRRTREELGTVDILINNAGLQQDAPIEEMTLAQWNKVIGVNLTGQFLCAREAIREFKRRGVQKDVSCAAGKIICISSVHEVIPWAVT